MFAVTLVQLAPPSFVSCTCPSLLPVHINPGSNLDSVMLNNTEPSKVMRLSTAMPPEFFWCVLSFKVKSGLITCQLCPPSSLLCTYWLPTYTLCLVCGEKANGKFQCQRYFSLPGSHP